MVYPSRIIFAAIILSVTSTLAAPIVQVRSNGLGARDNQELFVRGDFAVFDGGSRKRRVSNVEEKSQKRQAVSPGYYHSPMEVSSSSSGASSSSFEGFGSRSTRKHCTPSLLHCPPPLVHGASLGTQPSLLNPHNTVEQWGAPQHGYGVNKEPWQWRMQSSSPSSSDEQFPRSPSSSDKQFPRSPSSSDEQFPRSSSSLGQSSTTGSSVSEMNDSGISSLARGAVHLSGKGAQRLNHWATAGFR